MGGIPARRRELILCMSTSEANEVARDARRIIGNVWPHRDNGQSREQLGACVDTLRDLVELRDDIRRAV